MSQKSNRSKPVATKSNTKQRKQKTKLKLRIPSKNPYGKIIENPENWPPRDEIDRVLKKGPSEMKKWQKSQIEELIVPHLNGEQIGSIIRKLGFNNNPSLLLHKIHSKLLSEFLNNTLNSQLQSDSDYSENNKKKLLNILRHSLRFIRIQQFKQLNVEILSRLDIIPKSVLRLLCDHKNQDLLLDFPINIKRQIWSHKLTLFDREFASILFNNYLTSICNDDGSSYFDHIFKFDDHDFNDNNNNLYIQLTKIKRANNDTLKLIVNDIGSSEILFNRSIQNIEKYYLKSLNENSECHWNELISFSNFRVDISCALYDHAHRLLINENDIIWKLIKMIYYSDDLEINEIYKLLMEPATSMFLCIPYIKSILFKSYIHLLQDIANKQILPRDSKSLCLLTTILSVAVSPKTYKTQNNNNRDTQIVLFQFDPLLTLSIYIDSLPVDAVNEIEYVLNEDIVKWSKESSLCCYILLYYVLFLLTKKRFNRLCQLIDISVKNELDCCYLLAMDGLTEINLICNKIIQLNADKDCKLNNKQKCKFLQFLICFVKQAKNDKELIEPIMNLIQNIALFGGDVQKFIKLLQH